MERSNMKSLIITAFGPDQPGLISLLSGIVTGCDGNIEDSRMLRMGEDFVMVILISILEGKKQKLEEKIKQNTHLVIYLHDTSSMQDDADQCVRSLVLTGADNEGIVHALTKFLAKMQINVSTLESNLSNAPVSGTPLFNLCCSLEVPKKIELETLREGVQELAQRWGVTITLSD